MEQWLNNKGVSLFLRALFTRPSLLLPHMRYRSVTEIDYGALRRSGARALIFDKDNTITLPYAEDIASPSIKRAMSMCCSVFKDKVFVFSNTIGGSGDRDNAGAAAFERKTGLQVITHAQQKPGGIEEVRAALADIPAESVVCIGDRVATDVLFANEHGYLSVLVDPVTKDEGALTRVLRTMEASIMYFTTTCMHRSVPPHPILERLTNNAANDEVTR